MKIKRSLLGIFGCIFLCFSTAVAVDSAVVEDIVVVEDIKEYEAPFVVFSLPKSGSHYLKSFFFNLEGYEIAHDHVHHHPNFSIDRLLRTYKNTKIIYPFRDPRDVLVSYIRWVDKMFENGLPSDWGTYFGHEEWQEWSRERKLLEVIDGTLQPIMRQNILYVCEIVETLSKSPNCIVMRFEDFIGPKAGGDKQIQIESMHKLVRFICNEDICDDELERHLEASWATENSTYNNPKIGRWEEYFTENVKSAFKSSIWNDALIRLGYEDNSDW